MLKNVSLKNKFQYALFFLTFILVVIILMTTYFLNRIQNQAENLYNHPYTVTNAIKDIESDIQTLYSQIQFLIVPQNRDELEETVAHIQTLEADVDEKIAILYERYLGDEEDIKSIEDLFKSTERKRDAVIQYVRLDDYDAAHSIMEDGKETKEEILTDIHIVIEFAENKAIEMQNEAKRLTSIYYTVSVISGIFAISLTITIVFLTMKDIKSPLDNLVFTINSHREGENETRLDVDRNDELGLIARNLKEMLDHIKTTTEIRELSLKLDNLRDKENLRITLMSIIDGVITTDLKGIVTNINPSASELTGYTPHEAVGKNILEVFRIFDKTRNIPIPNPIQSVIKNGEIKGLSNNTVLLSQDGQEYNISESAAPILDQDGQIVGVVVVFRDMTEEYRKKQEIEYLSYHDQLTSLYNRNYLEKEMRRCQERNTNGVGIIMGDVNGLKIANDAFGHKFGDQLLIEVAKILKSATPEESIISRWGGDEFVILLKNMDDEKMEKICKDIHRLSESYKTEAPFKPSISLGHAIKTTKYQNLYRTLIMAEDMMYENKLLEKNSLRSEIVNGIQKSLFEKSFETEEHANRVSEYGKMIAMGYGMHENEINKVVLLSKLHDIGKISIEDSLLSKQGKLSQEEWKIMKKHPETGYRIATSLSELAHIADGILSHHEHYDGKGYPRGIKGESIPLYARIISIADAFDVMTSGRSYKKAMTIEQSIEELRRCKGTQFDPSLVEIFIQEIQKESPVN